MKSAGCTGYAALRVSGEGGTPRSSPAGRPRAVLATLFIASLSACATLPASKDGPETADLLRNSLPVAAAALSAGQVDVARRLYLSLAEHFDEAAEPQLGLGYVAFQGRDFANAEKYFLRAAEQAADTPAMLSEALLGAGRAALVQDRVRAARRHFRKALEPARETPQAAWIANGLAVTAALEADYPTAEAHYTEALRLSSGHPRIAANHVRMLVAAGRLDDAARAYAKRPPSYWADEDGPAISHLIEQAQREERLQALARPAAAADTQPDRPGTASPRKTESDAAILPPRATGPSRGRPGEADPAPAPGPFDTRLSLRLYVPGPPAGHPSDDPLLPEGFAGADSADLMLMLAEWTGPQSPAPDVDDDVAMPTASGAGVIGGSPSPPAAVSGTSAALAARSSTSPGPIAVQPGSPAPATKLAAPPPDPAALAAGIAATQPVSGTPMAAATAPGSGPSAQPPAPPGLEPAAVASGAARVHPLPDSEATEVAVLDSSAPTTLSLPVGQSRRLHLENTATSILVASPEIADVQLLAANVLYIIGKTVGRTSVAVLDDNKWVEERVISVVLDVAPLRKILAGEPDLAAVQARRLARGIALTGAVASAASVDRALRLAAGALPEGVPIENEMQVTALQQVNLEVQIAEVSRLVTEELGVNWEAIGIDGTEEFGFRIGRFNPLDPDGFAPVEFAQGQASSIFLGSQGPWRGRFRAIIDALATAGLANVLARPNVTAISGESASFFSGGERPIPTGYNATTDTIVFEYKKVGVLLDFVPTVVDSGRIVLTVRPEVSEPDFSQPLAIGPVVLPVINVRRAETTVEVGNGESIVIAGLFRNRSSTTETGVPGLKDVPMLGVLFGRTATQSDELELIVIVTARLVEPNAVPEDSGAPPATLQANGYHY